MDDFIKLEQVYIKNDNTFFIYEYRTKKRAVIQFLIGNN